MESVDLAGTNVEEWDDLGVAIIVQDQSTKYIWQSDYTHEDATFATDATLTDLTVDGVTIEGFSPDVYEYTITLPQGTTDIPVVDGVVADENATKIVVPANELPGSTTVDVFAEDLATYITYTVNFDLSVGFGDQTIKAVHVYPNPTTGQVSITGVEHVQVTVINTTGAVVAKYDDFSSGMINLSNLDEGIYFLNILIDDQRIINKKISLIK
jgi:hypothetical protein